MIDAELVRNGRNEGVRLGNGLVRAELLHQDVGLGGGAAAEDGAGLLAEVADLVRFLAAAAELGAVAVIEQRENAAANGDAGSTDMAGFLPGGAIGANLGRLLAR